MAGRGRPRKPTEVKKRQGTYRPDRDPSAGNLAVVPALPVEAHDLTPADALERVLEQGAYWIAESDGPAVALLREALEDYAALRGTPGVPPREVREAREQVMRMLGQMGFDPASRTKLGVAEVKMASGAAKLAELRKRKRGAD